MAYVVTRRALIGEWREPGYVCTSEDLRGRNVQLMEDKERTIRWDPTVDEPKAQEKPGRGRPKAAVKEDGGEE